LKSNARDTLTQFPAAVLNTLQEKYGGLDKIVTSLSESPISTFADVLSAIGLAKGIGKTVATGVAASSKRLRPLIPLAEEAAEKGRAITPPVLKEIGRNKYDMISKNELSNVSNLSSIQNKLAELKDMLKKSKDVSPSDDIIKQLDILDNEVDTIGKKIAADRSTYGVELDTLPDMQPTPIQDKLLYNPNPPTDVSPKQKIAGLSNKIDDMMQQSAKIAEEATARIGGDIDGLHELMQYSARNKMGYVPMPTSDSWTLSQYASNYKTLGDTIDAMSIPDMAIIGGTALQPQSEMMLPSLQGTLPKAVRMGMTDRIDDIIAELIDVQNRKKRAKSNAELDRLDSQLNELENQLRNELVGYLQP
jgi:hypothetical protein